MNSSFERVALRELNAEVDVIMQKLGKLPINIEEKREEILRPAAELLQTAAANNVKNADRVVKRYATSKFSKKMRAPKGAGKVLAVYNPGNLKLAIQVLKFRRSKALFVGAKVAKRGKSGGEYGKGKRADGWYAHLVEFGSRHASPRPFMRPAVQTHGRAVQKRIIMGLNLQLMRWQRQNATI